MESSFRRRVDPPGDAFLSEAQNLIETTSQPTGSTRERSLAGPSRRTLRRPRHGGIFEALHRLDAHIDAAARAELARWIRDEYTSEFGDVPLGFVARCHLGPPFIDHRLDLFHSIVDHYAPGDVMPDPYNGARMLARTGGYEFVEVYASGDLRPVLADGSVVA